MMAIQTKADTDNKAFIGGVSLVLIAAGAVGLVLGASCWVVNWGYCDAIWVPLVVGTTSSITDVLLVNLPLALLILGLASRQFAPLGWLIAVMLTAAQCAFFGVLVYLFSGKGKLISLLGSPHWQTADILPWVRTCVTDLVLALLSLSGLLLLAMPAIRKLYFPSDK